MQTCVIDVCTSATIAAHIFIYACLREEFQEFKLSECPQAKQSMLKRKNFFDGNLATSGLVCSRNNSTVSTLTNSVEDLVVGTCDDNGRSHSVRVD